jgi:divalent metal cation (Fe/Co/Zn/Cd) transporter
MGLTIDMSTISRPNPVLAQARLAQGMTLGWLVIELVLAMAAGLAAHSIALTAFGADSAVEVVTAAVVLAQLSSGATGVGSDSVGARRASRAVGFGLYAVAGYIVVAGAYALASGVHPEATSFGVAVAVLSVTAMTVLWRWRLNLSERLHSSALRADAACSAVCVWMALTMLAGLALNRALGWWWADPVAGLGMIWWIQAEAREALEAARTGRHCEDC